MSWLITADVSEVIEKKVLPVELDGLRIALFALDGEIFATGNICTHQFALLSDGYVEDGCVECPLHQGLFDIRTGKAKGAPVSEDIPTYAVKIENGKVFVDLHQASNMASGEGPASGSNMEMNAGAAGIVIIGAGQAGARAAEAARLAGYAGTITLIGDEDAFPYERPFLSKGFLTGKADLESAYVLSSSRITELDLVLKTGVQVTAIDREGKRLSLSDGSSLSYEKALIATGAGVRKLAIPGADLAEVFYLRTVADARTLSAALAKAEHVVVIGGGFIGLEVASSVRDLGKQVSLLEREPRLMSRVLPAAASLAVAAKALAFGVDIVTDAAISRIDGKAGRVQSVVLADGKCIPADMVIIGVGAVPNTALAEAAGLKITNGIAVDAFGRTSDPDIFAAGDVASYPNAPEGGPTRLESWQNAQEQAIAAGRTMAGQPTAYDTLPWFWSDQFGGTIQIVGLPEADAALVRREGAAESTFSLFCFDANGCVSGAIAFDDAPAIRLARKLIDYGKPVDRDNLANRSTELDDIIAASETFEKGTDEIMSMADIPRTAKYRWPAGGINSIPDWVYTDDAIYRREVERIFHGRTWNYVALEAEIPEPGCFVRSNVGPTPVVVSRGNDGEINVFENRCAHRAAEFCREQRGKKTEFVCPYHQWSYDLAGNLSGVPFRRGVNGKGGMGADFKPEDHGVKKLSVTTRGGVVFASFVHDMEPFDEYLGTDILEDFDATFDGRKLKILGYYRNTLPGNWKLYHENLKDPYHATLLHTFLVTFGLLVAGNKSAMICDPTGRHGTMASAKSDGKAVEESTKKEMRAYRDGMTLNEPRFMDYIEEFNSPWSVTMQTIWPNLIVQREMNTLGVRQIVPNGPNEFVMNWTMFGFEGDDDEMTRHRLRQGNLMGPSGYLGLEDNEAMKFVQDGMLHSTGGEHLIALDPNTPMGTSDTLISESAIRGMYRYWREQMGL